MIVIRNFVRIERGPGMGFRTRAVIEHGVGQQLKAKRMFAMISRIDCERGRKTAAGAFAANCDAGRIDLKFICFLMQPREDRISIH